MSEQLPLLERAQELEGLRALLLAAREGRGGVCMIEGPAGIGKTALLTACSELAADIGVRTLRARSGPLEGDLAWNIVRQLFAEVIAARPLERSELLSGAASHAAPALGLGRGSADGTLHGLYWLTAALAQRESLVLIVDDLHWSDVPSLRYLAYVGARTGDLPVAIVVGLRTGERALPEISALAAGPHVGRLEPASLSADATAAIVRSELGGQPAPEFCSACHLSTGGNPFLVHELAGQIRRENLAPTAAHAADVARVTPGTVTRAVLLRLASLPDAARRLGAAVAILDGRTTIAEAAALAGIPRKEATEPADALVAAAVLAPGRELAFVHPLVREAVYTSIPGHERARLHGQAARLLAAGGASAARIAAQLLAAEPDGDPSAVVWLEDAADAALERGDPASAADFLERAVREPPAADARRRLLAKLGRAEVAAGRRAGPERLREAVELSSEPADRGQLALDLGRSLYLAGRSLEGAAAVQRGLEELGALDDQPLRASLQAVWLSIARTEKSLRSRAVELAERLTAHPPRGESYGERALRAQLAGELVFAGHDRALALELAHSASSDGAIIREGPPDGIAWLAVTGALNWGGDPASFDVLAQAALEDARRRGSLVAFATASYNISSSHYRDGLLLDSIADLEQAIAGESDGFQHRLPAARAQLVWVLIDRGELDQAAGQLHAARGDAAWRASTMQGLVLEAETELHLARGDAARALEVGLEVGRIAADANILNPAVTAWRSRTALAAARIGQRDLAEQLLTEELELARAFGAPRAIAVALIAAGQISGGEATEPLEEAAALLDGTPYRLDHARALVHLGAALGRRHRVRSAREILRRGMELSADFEATALERFARNQLLATGARPRRAHRSGHRSLTPSELRVAELAAQGLSNREIAEALFISLRTVETHLTHAYRKLDIDSREKLEPALAAG